MREFLRRAVAKRQHWRHNRHLRLFGDRLHDPDIWHLNRRSASGGVALGLFVAFMPIPSQMILAALLSVLLRVNLPLAVASVWVTNPLTMPLLFYAAYWVGARLIGGHPDAFQFELSLRWFTETIVQIWQPLLLGCVLLGAISAVIGGFLIRLLWRLHLVRRWRQRKHRDGRKTSSSGTP